MTLFATRTDHIAATTKVVRAAQGWQGCVMRLRAFTNRSLAVRHLR